MLINAFLLLINSTLMMLRLGKREGSFPRTLRAEEEREYVQRWLCGDLEARNKLIEHNLRLVAHIMKKYYTPESDQDDLISIGTIGLIKGISTYSPEKGVRLATYASRCIENEVLMYFRGMKKSSGDLSLSESIDVDGDGNSLSLMDILAQEDDMAERLSAEETCERLHRFIRETLLDREADIIRMRYGLDGLPPRTQREVAAVCGISRSYVSRIEKKALEKLRCEFEREG
jgi:RNA polymerase sporulation-specific sigma factor